MSDFHVKITWQNDSAPQPSVALTFHVCVLMHDPIVDTGSAVRVISPQELVTVPARAMTMASVSGVELLPRSMGPGGQFVKTGADPFSSFIEEAELYTKVSKAHNNVFIPFLVT